MTRVATPATSAMRPYQPSGSAMRCAGSDIATISPTTRAAQREFGDGAVGRPDSPVDPDPQADEGALDAVAPAGLRQRATGREVARDGRGHARTLVAGRARGHPPDRPMEPRHSAATGSRRRSARAGVAPCAPLAHAPWGAFAHVLDRALAGTALRRARGRIYSPLFIHCAYSLCTATHEVDLVHGTVAHRRHPARPRHRHAAAGPEGQGARGVRRGLDIAQPAARLPDRAGPRGGPHDRGHRRQPVPRLRGRHRRHLDRPLASAGRGRDQGAGRGADPLQRERLLPADLPRGLPAPGRALPDQGRAGADVPGQLRGGGRRGLDQAGPLCDPPSVCRGLPGRLPRADLRGGLADGLQGEVPRRLRAAAPRRLPRAVRARRGPALVRRRALRQARPRQRGGGDHRRADPGRGRLHRPRGRLPAGTPPDLRRARDPADRRRDPVRAPVAPARCGRSSTGASSRTSS